MTSFKSQQARSLKRRAISRLAIGLAGFSLCHLLIAACIQIYAMDDIANAIAEATSKEFVVGMSDTYPENWQVVKEHDDGTVTVRDLSIYYVLRSLKTPLCVFTYVAGATAVSISVALAQIRSFDELAATVTGLLENPSAPIELPDTLAQVRAELVEIRARSLAADAAAHDAERRKNELVAYLAHDIKGPLTAVVGYLSILEETPELPDANRIEFARIAGEKAQRLSGLVDDLFEITRYDLHAMSLERERIDMRLFFQQVAEELEPEALRRQIELKVDAETGLEAFIDPDKMARAVSNVLRNAIAYADPRTAVSLDARYVDERAKAGRTGIGQVEGASDERGGASTDGDKRTEGRTAADGAPAADHANGHPPVPPTALRPADEPPAHDSALRTIEIAITDRGREISPQHLEIIFEKFYREDASRSANRGGAGLGLAIAREVVEAHGGRISARSENGVTTFTLALPA